MINTINIALIRIVTYMALSTAFIMTVFEIVKQLVNADLTLWISHIVTILFTTILSASLTFFALKKQYSLLRILSSIIPMCAWCKRIRDEKGEWVTMESYLEKYSSAGITHSICRECSIKLKEGTNKE